MSAPAFPDTAAYLQSLDCVHCGLCIEHCPTYRLTGRETANPRGRVSLMRALYERRITATPAVERELDLCLVCRACESACPSGVRFAEILADTRARLRRRGALRRWLFSRLESRRRLHGLASLLRLAQGLGLAALARRLPGRIGRLAAYAPPIPPRRARRPLPARTPAQGEHRGRVALLEGCVMSILFAETHRDTARLLAAAGYEVLALREPACCGALHEHDGDPATARRLLAQLAAAVDDPGILAFVSNSAGCGAWTREAARHLSTEAAEDLGSRTLDWSRFLLGHGGALRFRQESALVAYDAPCHLHHGQRETRAPEELLARVPGLRVVPLPGTELCCGAAGVYNLDHPEESSRLLDLKLDELAASGAGILLTGNPGCILQWRAGVRRRGLGISVLHPASFLASRLES
jgi:glycolate oxidase iron-sulfur subunit